VPSAGRCDPEAGYKRPKRQLASLIYPAAVPEAQPLWGAGKEAEQCLPQEGASGITASAQCSIYRYHISFSARRGHSGFAGFSF
jgi:hypothetical protein